MVTIPTKEQYTTLVGEAQRIARRWLDYVDKKAAFKGLTMNFADFTTVCRALCSVIDKNGELDEHR